MKVELPLAGAAVIFTFAALAASARADQTWARDGAAAPSLFAGMLSAPRGGSPVDIARDYLAGAAAVTRGVAVEDFRVERESRYPVGSAVKYLQTFHGLDVVGATVFVRLDDQGRVRWVSSEAVKIPEEFTTVPAYTAYDVLHLLGADPALRVEDHARLVIYAAPLREPRLAWMLVLPPNLELRQVLRIYVDAQTSAVLAADNLAKTAKQANVFDFNPVSTPSLKTVTLDTDGSAHLQNADFVANNCIDRMTCPLMFQGIPFRFCEIEPKARADGNGDFKYQRPAVDTTGEDEFAEVQMFYHVSQALAAFRAFGFGNLSARPMSVIVNLRIPPLSAGSICSGPTSTTPLSPFDNAAFMPAGAIGGIFPADDSMVFGQGVSVDYAYDGDVVFHELTHAVVATLTPMGQVAIDQYGLDTTMGGMHEAQADFFSSTITGDPEVGEYAGSGIPGGTGGAIRSLTNHKHCPESLDGEVHDNSEVFSGALWDFRTSLSDADKHRFDGAYFTVIDGYGEVESFDTARVKLGAEVQLRLGQSAADSLAAKLAARGLDGCNHRVRQAALGAADGFVWLYGTDVIPGQRSVPGPVQYELTLSKPAKEIDLTVDKSAVVNGAGVGAPSLQLLVKAGSPIQWSPSSMTSDATAMGAVTIAAGSSAGTGKVTGSFAPGTYYVMFVNNGPTMAMKNAKLITDAESTGGGPPDAGVGGPADAGETTVGASSSSGGCGCQVGAGRSPGGIVVVLIVGAALIRRRRTVTRIDRGL